MVSCSSKSTQFLEKQRPFVCLVIPLPNYRAAEMAVHDMRNGWLLYISR
jgi:hypothetical protein